MNVSALMAQLAGMPHDADVVVCEGLDGGCGGQGSRAIEGVRLQRSTVGEHAAEHRLVIIDVETVDQDEDDEDEFELFQDGWPNTPKGRSHMMVSSLAARLRHGAQGLSGSMRMQCLIDLARVKRSLLEPKHRRLYDEFEKLLSSEQ